MIATYGQDPTLSPREFARALGVSESSVKRWVDAGRVPARRTSGGHRRIELASALRFLRDSGHELAQPAVLGLPPTTEPLLGPGAALGERVYELLQSGREEELARTLLMLLSTRKIEVAALFDGPLREAMVRIGELWQGGFAGIYEEHRATQALLRVLDQIDGLFEPADDGPVAVGGSIDGDPGLLAARMAATVLASEDVQSVNLGADTPAQVLRNAAQTVGARLVWVSAGYILDAGRQGSELRALFTELAGRGVHCVLGGREAHRLQVVPGDRVHVGEEMAQVARLARQLSGETSSA